MITSAAVKIFDKRQNKEIIIPCHRHWNAFFILKELGYKNIEDYEVRDQGFLDEETNFLSRTEAMREALVCNQLKDNEDYLPELFSEDLW